MAAEARNKKIHVSAAALVDLKAELFHKQQEFRREKPASQNTSPRRVSEKTSSIWRQVGQKSKRGKKKVSKEEVGGREDTQQLSHEEEEQLAKSRRALEAKALLYDRLCRGEGLRVEDDSEGEEGEEGGRRGYMVDFTKKIVQELNHSKNSNMEDTLQSHDHEEEGGGDGEEGGGGREEEWVEYQDSLGRSRRCLKEDLPRMRELDQQLATDGRAERSPSPDLMSMDMQRERERQAWEQLVQQEVDKPAGPVHYQDVQQGEIRTHGAGYYAFSTEESKRAEQMDLLNKLREQTFQQREKRQKLQERRKAMMEARLAKVRQRKLKQKPGTPGENVEESRELKEDIADINFEDGGRKVEGGGEGGGKMNVGAMIEAELTAARERAKQEREEREEEERKAHLRPWDRGKVIDPIRKRKKELQSERPPEFAPPAAYFDQQPHPEPKKAKHELTGLETQDDDSGGVSSAPNVLSEDSSAHPQPASSVLQPSTTITMTTITMTTNATGNPPYYGMTTSAAGNAPYYGIPCVPPGISLVPPPPTPHGPFITPPLPTHGQFVTPPPPSHGQFAIPPPPSHGQFVTSPPPHHTQFIPQPLPNYGQFVPLPPHEPIYHLPYGQFVSPPPPPGEQFVHSSPTPLSDPLLPQYMTPLPQQHTSHMTTP